MTTIILEYPVEFEGKTYTELTLNRPKAGEIAQIEQMLKADGLSDEDRVAAGIIMIAVCAGVPVDLIRLLDFADFTEASEAAGSFLQRRGRSKDKRAP